MIVIIMGVAGSGKTTVGVLLAELTGYPFIDADTLHPPANVDKMSAGIPLSEADRAPWLAAIRERLVDAATGDRSLLVACSALRAPYRAFLAHGLPVTWVYLKGPPDLFRGRLQHRIGHFMKADLLSSQFDALEEPSDAIVVDASQAPAVIARDIADRLKTHDPSPDTRPA
jgi:gluconokinase